jgi:hypothetical protein
MVSSFFGALQVGLLRVWAKADNCLETRGDEDLRTTIPSKVLRDLVRIRGTHPEVATRMPFAIGQLSVHSTMRWDSHATRRVKTEIVRDYTRDDESA